MLALDTAFSGLALSFLVFSHSFGRIMWAHWLLTQHWLKETSNPPFERNPTKKRSVCTSYKPCSTRNPNPPNLPVLGCSLGLKHLECTMWIWLEFGIHDNSNARAAFQKHQKQLVRAVDLPDLGPRCTKLLERPAVISSIDVWNVPYVPGGARSLLHSEGA